MSQLSLFDKQTCRKKRQYRYDPVAMSIARKGRKSWNKGLTAITDERIKKNAERGRKTRKKLYSEGKIKPWNFGIKIDRNLHPNMGHHKKHSEESKKKMSEAGLKNPRRYWMGKNLSEETKRKLSEKHKLIGNRPPSQKGAIVSIETRLKRSASHRGEKHHNWQGGITSTMEAIRNSIENKIWKKSVFKRDKYTCIICGIKGASIEADHYPKMFSEIFKDNKIKSLQQAIDCPEFWDISNGRTLCKDCHKKHGRRKKKK